MPIRHIHRFLQQHAFYALMITSSLTVGMLVMRAVHYHSLTFTFLVWNLVLAWIPYLASLWAASMQARRPEAWWLLLPVGAIWLLFFPNALYLVTDLVHLRERPPVPFWYDLGLLTTFMLNGCWLAVVSLHIMQRLVRHSVGAVMSWIFVLLCCGLSGFGVYLGRELRWNSWDVFVTPNAVLADVLGPLLNPRDHVLPLAISAVFAAVLLICYLLYSSALQHGPYSEQSQRRLMLLDDQHGELA